MFYPAVLFPIFSRHTVYNRRTLFPEIFAYLIKYFGIKLD